MTEQATQSPAVGHPNIQPVLPLRPARWVNPLIRLREAALNRLVGVRTDKTINGDLPEIAMDPPDDLAARLRHTLLDLRASVMDAAGDRVDYAALRTDAAYGEYRAECLAVLRLFRPENLGSRAERLTFWINLYNALVLDAVISFGIQHSVTEGRLGLIAFFRRAAYLVGGQRVSLEDIEHGILRANRGHPYLPGLHFPGDDPRLSWSVPLDPRIHFALNCGGRSCPPIRAYGARKLDHQLDLAARSFVDATTAIHPDAEGLAISQIFRWYEGDFGGRSGLIAFLIEHLPDDDRRRFAVNRGDRLRLDFSTYDWQLNAI